MLESGLTIFIFHQGSFLLVMLLGFSWVASKSGCIFPNRVAIAVNMEDLAVYPFHDSLQIQLFLLVTKCCWPSWV